MYVYSVTEFLGIQQHKDGCLLPNGSASDARNVDTSNGDLRLAKGFEKHISAKIPSNDKILKLFLAKGTSDGFYVVTENNIYAYRSGAWNSIYTFSSPITGEQVDYLQTQIGTDDCIVVSTGHQQMVKIKLGTNIAVPFGTGAYSFDGTVTEYDSATLSVTLSEILSDEALRHAPLDGISINGVLHDVLRAENSADGGIVTLKELPDTPPTAGDTATVRGGGSSAPCNFVDLYAGRLFAAGDPSSPCRLYWSAATGGGHTVEDWLSAETEDASGGYVEIGDAFGDKIIGLRALSSHVLIFKRYSVYRLYGDRPSNYTVERVENFSREISNAGIVVKYDTPYWFTKDGMNYYDGTGILPMTYGYRVIGKFLETVDTFSASKALHCNNVMYFTCKTDKRAKYDNAMIVYDVARETFIVRDGFEIADIFVNDGHIYITNGSRYVCEFLKGYSYDGSPISAYWESQASDLGAKNSLKEVNELMFRGKNGRMLITVRCGKTKAFIQRNLFPDNDGFNAIPVKADKARVIEFRIENENGSYFEITGGFDMLFTKELNAK